MPKYSTIEIDLTQACVHCDASFPKSYLTWHASRAIRNDGRAQLTCRKCGCWTPVMFKIERSATRKTETHV